MTNEIRSYGLGKFDTLLDSYVWSVSLEGGTDDEIGESEYFGWYGLMRNGRTIFRDHDPFLETLNDAEREMLTSAAGVIVSEDSYGFVGVVYFDTTEALEKEWNHILAEYEAFELEKEWNHKLAEYEAFELENESGSEE